MPKIVLSAEQLFEKCILAFFLSRHLSFIFHHRQGHVPSKGFWAKKLMTGRGRGARGAQLGRRLKRHWTSFSSRWPSVTSAVSVWYLIRNQLGLTRLSFPHRILLSFGGTAPNLSPLTYFMVSPSSDFLFLIILWNTNCRSAAWNSISDCSCLKPDLTFVSLIFEQGVMQKIFFMEEVTVGSPKNREKGLENKIAKPSAISCGFNFGIMAQIWSWAPLAEF